MRAVLVHGSMFGDNHRVVVMDHASSSIEKGLARLGGSRLVQAEHFRVADMKGPLEPGEEARAHAWGTTLAGLLVSCPAR